MLSHHEQTHSFAVIDEIHVIFFKHTRIHNTHNIHKHTSNIAHLALSHHKQTHSLAMIDEIHVFDLRLKLENVRRHKLEACAVLLQLRLCLPKGKKGVKLIPY